MAVHVMRMMRLLRIVKEVNDADREDIGDLRLTETAKRLLACIRHQPTV